jgi:dihydrofolate synthase/folylpolyglutamate synthase
VTYHDAIEFLYGLRLFGAKLGLENTRKLAAMAGSPQEKLRFIHVAGTNGKGSTCAMLESIYREAGLRVGLFTSPHLVSFAERIQVNRRLIPETDVVRLVERMQELLKNFPIEAHPTFFEVVTVMALMWFAEQHCDLVIWETGLGGRLDATNIVTPLASVITNIQFDHERWLGNSLSDIAREKAGIIKPGVPVVSGAEGEEVLGVIRATAAGQDSALTLVTRADAGLLRDIQLPLLGAHQRFNAAVALAVVRLLQDVLPVGEAQWRSGLEKVNWPGRLQLVSLPGGRRMLLDGAHNPAGAETLRDVLADSFAGTRRALILGILEDKDWRKMCEILAPMADRVLVVPVGSERTLPAETLAAQCRQVNSALEVKSCASLADALQAVSEEPFVVIAGSLYLMGEAMELLRLTVAPAEDEKGLNTWQATDRFQPRKG